MNIILSPSNIYWSSKYTRSMSKFYYYFIICSLHHFDQEMYYNFLLVYKREIH